MSKPIYDYGICYPEICEVTRNKKIGFIDYKGVRIIPCKYSQAYLVTKGIISLSNEEDKEITFLSLDYKTFKYKI
ncbi:hypothetical protein GCM10022393_00260 [Aquimarina addita]|uniref:WG repeat-containing protein n=1 Tax=Aquimarina addita TaxID=870485 RepID=A0ABP7X6W5_9FLAO